MLPIENAATCASARTQETLRSQLEPRVSAKQVGEGLYDETEFEVRDRYSRGHKSEITSVRVRNVGDANKEATIQFSGKVMTESYKGNWRTTHFDFSIPKDLVPLFLRVVSGEGSLQS